MSRLVLETDDVWMQTRIAALIRMERELLMRSIENVEKKISVFSQCYGTSDRDALFGAVDDMALLEWEGEMETLDRLKRKLRSLEELTLEFK